MQETYELKYMQKAHTVEKSMKVCTP